MYSFEAIKSESPYYQEVILYFKVNPCPNYHPYTLTKHKTLIQPCNQPICFNYHEPDEKRRPVFSQEKHSLLYLPTFCAALQDYQQCRLGDECGYSHTHNELNFHPLFYKTEPCEGCDFTHNPKLCPRYHSDEANRLLMLEKFRMKENGHAQGLAQGLGQGQGPRSFSLNTFKTKLCNIKGNHNPKVCDHYHFDKDRRRPPNVYNYSTNLCRYIANNMECPQGDECGNCHNKVEELYHPERYKRKFCLCHPHNIHKCEYGSFCSFAHSEGEIKIELLHNMKKDEQFYLHKYKTVYCPYIYNHDRNQCVYAHNPQDYRRDPQLYQYNPVKCPNWVHGQVFSYEEGGCPKQMECENCHGWKELEYHPKYYKTQNCGNAKNCIKVDCPFLHPNKDIIITKAMGKDYHLNMGGSPQKQAQGQGFGCSDNYFHFKAKNESHFQGPIIPIREDHHNRKGKAYEEFKDDESHKQTLGSNYSTRPNSNVSSMYYAEEDVAHVPFNNNKLNNKKKKKKKQMSLQDRSEEMIISPLSIDSDFPFKGKGPKRISSPQINWGRQASGSEEKSFESLFEKQNTTPTENSTTTMKAGSNNNEQFKIGLMNTLKKKGLEYAIPSLFSPRVDIEALKSFSVRDFGQFPKISLEDKEKIALIIRKIVEEGDNNAILGVNNHHVLTSPFEMMIGENQYGGNLDFLDERVQLEFTKHPFN